MPYFLVTGTVYVRRMSIVVITEWEENESQQAVKTKSHPTKQPSKKKCQIDLQPLFPGICKKEKLRHTVEN